MKLTFETQRIDKGIAAIERYLKTLRLKKAHVKAGFIGSQPHEGTSLTVAQLGSIHEYGLGNVPARPFMGPAFLKNRERYFEILVTAYQEALRTNRPENFMRVLKLLGLKMSADIKAFIVSGEGMAPLAPSTIKRKGSTKPLIDTAQMLNSISFEVVE